MSSALVARMGRERQRYKDHLRLVSGCIPYRLEKSVEIGNLNSENKLLVLMISSPNRDDLVFPKGGWEDDETIHEAASREALEEAGVRGILAEKPLGVWEFRSKSKQDSGSLVGGCRGSMFALEVTEELDFWPEQANHERKWLTTEEAFKFCRYDWMREALEKLMTALVEDRKIPSRQDLVELPRRAERQILSPGCFGKPSGVQHLGESRSKCIVQA